jgi:hypothetical protein
MGLLADVVVALHALFVVFVVLGGLLVLRWPRAAWAHLPAAAWGVWIEWSGAICPLTHLENRLRRLAGEAGSTAGFVERAVSPVLYPDGLSRNAQITLGAAVLLMNSAIYAVVLLRRCRKNQ